MFLLIQGQHQWRNLRGSNWIRAPDVKCIGNHLASAIWNPFRWGKLTHPNFPHISNCDYWNSLICRWQGQHNRKRRVRHLFQISDKYRKIALSLYLWLTPRPKSYFLICRLTFEKWWPSKWPLERWVVLRVKKPYFWRFHKCATPLIILSQNYR